MNDSTQSSRKNHTAAEKVAVLRRHLLEEIPISVVCEQAKIHPTVFYRWQKVFFENAAAAFEKPQSRTSAQREDERLAALEAKLRRKDEVLSELMEEHIALKKKLGEI